MWVKKVNVVGDNILDKTYIAENISKYCMEQYYYRPIHNRRR